MKFAHVEPAQVDELAKTHVCDTCKWSTSDHYCANPTTFEWDPIHGYEEVSCSRIRSGDYPSDCGPEGKLWEPKLKDQHSPLFYAWLFLALVAGWFITWGWLHGIF